MKKILLLVVLTVTFVFSSNAQSIKYGAKAGANFANLTGDDVDDAEIRTSFHIGGVAEIMFMDKFSFQPELLFSSQGTRFSFEEDGINIESTVRLNYLNLPLTGKFYPTEALSVQVGPQIGFLLSAEAEFEIFGQNTEEDIKDEIKAIDFGVNLGLGYKMPSGLFFDARYNLGLSDIDDVDENINVRNSVIQVSVGYMF